MVNNQTEKSAKQTSNEPINYEIIVDEVCSLHGGRNFSYRYHDETFDRVESVCEGCNTTTPHQLSSEVQSARDERHSQSSRPARPTRR